jgi:hypothetical protein
MDNADKLRAGMAVRTHTKLDSTIGRLVAPQNLCLRRPATNGTVLGYVPGYGGDVWWVDHENGGGVAPYCYTEFDLIVG